MTDEHFFHGSDRDLVEVRGRVPAPVLRKDFTISSYQIYEARALGADAILLIVSMLSDELINTFLDVADCLGMDALVETHTEDEARRAVALRAPIVGINNRDLGTFEVDLATTERLRPLIPEGTIVVSESGVLERSDVERATAAGASAVLVGEALVTAADPGAKVRELLGLGTVDLGMRNGSAKSRERLVMNCGLRTTDFGLRNGASSRVRRGQARPHPNPLPEGEGTVVKGQVASHCNPLLKGVGSGGALTLPSPAAPGEGIPTYLPDGEGTVVKGQVASHCNPLLRGVGSGGALTLPSPAAAGEGIATYLPEGEGSVVKGQVASHSNPLLKGVGSGGALTLPSPAAAGEGIATYLPEGEGSVVKGQVASHSNPLLKGVGERGALTLPLPLRQERMSHLSPRGRGDTSAMILIMPMQGGVGPAGPHWYALPKGQGALAR